ncbi:DUF4192 domain-containing protein [Actinokineospora sp.]|uniref:DUF4192 domain-containing protein n=1 Tax=Actinokineospora sp. TaxID=1872133 RepID=UPI0040382F51
MRTPLHTTLTLANGGDLVAAAPHLLGFHPDDSLVVISLVPDESPGSPGHEEGIRVGPVMRVDLPAARHRAAVARQLSTTVVDHGAAKALVLVTGGGTARGPDSMPHRELVDELTRALAAADVTVDHALWARAAQAGETWWCYFNPDCTGIVPDPDATTLAAAMAVAGAVKYPSRKAMADSLASDPPAALDRRAALLDARVEDELRAADEGTCDPDAFQRDLAVINAAIADVALPDFDLPTDSLVRMPTPPTEFPTTPGRARPAAQSRARPPDQDLDDDRLAALAMALSHSDIRGECLKLILTDRAAAADRLWIRLTRALPAPERAEPACLVAISAYLRGEGTLASIALEVALAANPAHTLAALLNATVDHAIAPTELRAIISRAARSAERR